MKRKLSFFRVPIIITVVIVLAVVVFSLLLNSGISKSNIEKNARVAMSIDSEWGTAQDSGEKISAFLFYDKETLNHTFSIYVKKHFLPGYEFTSGGATPYGVKGIVEFSSDNIDETVYLSMNTQKTSQAKIDNGISVEEIEIVKDKPFVIIAPNDGSVFFLR